LQQKNNKEENETVSNLFALEELKDLSIDCLRINFSKLPASWGTKTKPAYNKLYYLKKGRFHFEIDGQTYEGCPGQMFLLPCNSEQVYHAYYDADAEKYWLHFSLKCDQMDLFEKISLPHFITVEDPEAVDELFQKAIESARVKDIEHMLLHKAYCMQLVSYYMRESTFEPLRVINDERILTIVRYINEHLSEDISLADLAKLVHFNPNYFVKYFKKITGKPPVEFLLNSRIDKAKSLLQSGDMQIKDIAFSVGFKDPDHFSHIFKQRTGYSPTRYREIAKNRESAMGRI